MKHFPYYPNIDFLSNLSLEASNLYIYRQVRGAGVKGLQ